MFEKILVPILFLGAQYIITWYAYFSGKISSKAEYLGMAYDSVFIRSIIMQFEYLWVLIIINILFSLAFHLGFTNYKNFLVINIMWIASGPIAALIFDILVTKEKLDWPIVVGIIAITVGALLVVSHKEIVQMFS